MTASKEGETGRPALFAAVFENGGCSGNEFLVESADWIILCPESKKSLFVISFEWPSSQMDDKSELGLGMALKLFQYVGLLDSRKVSNLKTY